MRDGPALTDQGTPLTITLDDTPGFRIDQSCKSNNAFDRYPTMHQFVTEMCTHAHHNFLLRSGALWDMELVHCGIWGSIHLTKTLINTDPNWHS